jgi:hypothetical protein
VFVIHNSCYVYWLKEGAFESLFFIIFVLYKPIKFFKMAKFLSIPVTSEGNQLVSADNIKLIEQASTTTVTIVYGGASAQDVVTITHATQSSGFQMRDDIQNAVVSAHQSMWQNVVETVAPSKAVSGIAIA